MIQDQAVLLMFRDQFKLSIKKICNMEIHESATFAEVLSKTIIIPSFCVCGIFFLYTFSDISS